MTPGDEKHMSFTMPKYFLVHNILYFNIDLFASMFISSASGLKIHLFFNTTKMSLIDKPVIPQIFVAEITLGLFFSRCSHVRLSLAKSDHHKRSQFGKKKEQKISIIKGEGYI